MVLFHYSLQMKIMILSHNKGEDEIDNDRLLPDFCSSMQQDWVLKMVSVLSQRIVWIRNGSQQSFIQLCVRQRIDVT